MNEDELKMTFDPNTIGHLGIKMYSNLPAALAELVANSYDAKADRVDIKLYDDGTDKSIVVSDNGIGMTFTEINKRFLKIGRNRRIDDAISESGERKVTGKKGLGKLALFGIGEIIKVETLSQESEEQIKFEMDWNAILDTTDDDYKPLFEKLAVTTQSQGTTISVTNLKRKSDFEINDLTISLSKLFNFLDADFRVYITLNDGDETEVTNELKYDSLDEQFNWIFPESTEGFTSSYNKKTEVVGKIITTKTPLRPGQRGITLFAYGRLVNLPDFFGHSESSNFFSYTTGWLSVDFVDEIYPDVISTDRQSLDWENPETMQLKTFLKDMVGKIHVDWRRKRREAAKDEIQGTVGVDTEKWLATVPPDKAKVVREAIDELSDPDTKVNAAGIITEVSHKIMPEYAELHWRYLHPTIYEIAEEYYVAGRYYEAAKAAAQLYVQRVRDMANINSEAMDKIFNKGNGILMVTDCSNESEENIQTGHQYLSMGIVSGCRNPLTHNPEYVKHLVDTGLFDEKACLDMLAVISHLFTRMDKAKLRPVPIIVTEPTAE